MTFNSLIVVLGLVSLLYCIAAIRSLRRHRIAGGVLRSATSLVFFLLAAGSVLVAANLRTYERLTAERAAGSLELTRTGYHEYNGEFVFPSGERADFMLRGDEFQVDARVLKWNGLANLVGFDTAYRFDRISGRYSSIDDERTLPRTVYALSPADRIDLWDMVHRYHSWFPWIDALYGSAAYLPMADGAHYDIVVSQSGLIARPANQPARAAVDSWH